ncbi:ABC-type nitrate/sulfonate/bicarbonate transport system permease component [Bacillus ectoiniformans]|uniref:ABC transporter permease n=1 Tax=Bacillus ectoiniformans TaxID=1494429 RepID=UPI00195BFF47|nr:ABC transporter permease [Bacillus ectoiniformans]MBM7649838.1 ABC-type nitrate/sulfonate/bicarbonate transport system permease component [Bacillus ectoiniformans]
MREVINQGWRPFLVLILFVSLWEIFVRVSGIEAWLLPAPTTIYQTAIESLPDFLPHFLSTVQLSVSGYLIGAAIGVMLAILLHLVPSMKKAMYPFLILSQNIPIIVLAPLLVIWFGFGALPKLIVIALVCFFPVVIATLDGFKQTPRELYHYMQMAGATNKQLFIKLEWPSSWPSLFSGLKISATYSVMGAVISEWLGAQQGVGVYMTLASSSFKTDKVFLAIFAVMGLSVLFVWVISALERRLVTWEVKSK